MSKEVVFVANEWNNQNDNTLNRMPTPGGYHPPMSGDPRRRPPTPNEQSGRHFIKEGTKTALFNLLFAAVVAAINLIVFHYFDRDIWSLYWLNAGFIIILPLFSHFNGIEVEVWEVNTGRTWTETQGCRGIVIGVIVLLVVTWLVFGLAEIIFPPYNYMTNFILYAVPTIISGGYVLKRLLDVYTSAVMMLAGRKLMKDASAPRVQTVMEKHGELRSRISHWLTIGTVAVCVLAFVGQYVQVLFVTPKIRGQLDTAAVYRTCEKALPFADEALTDLDGEYSEFSTRFATKTEADLTYGGVTGHYVAELVYHYGHETDAWRVSQSVSVMSITAADVKGTWSSDNCQDHAAGAEAFGITLEIAEMTTEKVSGVIRFMSSDKQIHESKFEGTVTVSGGNLVANATMKTAYNVFFDAGYTELNFKYQIADGSFVFDGENGDYNGYLEKQ